MTRIIQLGIPLPVLPPEVDIPVPMVLSLAATPQLRPPLFQPSPDTYLQELLARNAALLAELRQLGLANNGLAAEASALRKQNDKLTSIQADLREQIARMQDEVRLLTTVNNLRRDQVTDLTATNANLNKQIQTLEGSLVSIEGIGVGLGSQRDEMQRWTDAVTAINKVLSQAIQNSGKDKK